MLAGGLAVAGDHRVAHAELADNVDAPGVIGTDVATSRRGLERGDVVVARVVDRRRRPCRPRTIRPGRRPLRRAQRRCAACSRTAHVCVALVVGLARHSPCAVIAEGRAMRPEVGSPRARSVVRNDERRSVPPHLDVAAGAGRAVDGARHRIHAEQRQVGDRQVLGGRAIGDADLRVQVHRQPVASRDAVLVVVDALADAVDRDGHRVARPVPLELDGARPHDGGDPRILAGVDDGVEASGVDVEVAVLVARLDVADRLAVVEVDCPVPSGRQSG